MTPHLDIRDIAEHMRVAGPPGLRFAELVPASRSAPPAPEFLLGAANALVHEEIFGQLELGAVGCYALDDAVVAPTGIAILGETAFTSPAFLHPQYHVATILRRLAGSALPERHVAGPLAVIYGPAHQTYGHWLVDFLPRLFVLQACGHDLARLRFVVPPDLSARALELLRLVGLAPEQLVRYAYWQEVLRTDLLLMPTGLRLHNRIGPLFAEATAFWTRLLRTRLEAASSPRGSRILLSRGRLGGEREMVNRAAIEAVAAQRGFAAVYPEAMSLAEQVCLFSEASLILGEYGSALHGSVFSGSEVFVCGLRGNSRHPSFVQSGIAGALGQRVGYVLGNTEGQDVAQRFAIEPADLERALDIMILAARREAGLAAAA